MATYYAKFRIPGVSTPQCAKIEANGQYEAKKIIESRHGEIKIWLNSPVAPSKPPIWFK